LPISEKSAEYLNQRIRDLFARVINVAQDPAVGEFIAEGYVEHAPIPGVEQSAIGPAGVAQRLQVLHSAFKPLQYEPNLIVAQGDIGAVRWTFTGKSVGPFLGFAPTGNTVTFTGMDFYRFDETGLIVEHWHEMDVAALTKQLSAASSGARRR
jgi:predicted ester cyclase